MIEGELARRADRLISDRRPFVLATVVRAQRPTSARPGDAAVVLPDGTIEGFVGGVCAEASVRLHGLKAIESGDPVLLKLIPGDADGSVAEAEPGDGAVVERNPCLSGGSMDIFLEPRLPALRVVVVGDSPIARAIERVAAAAGYDAVRRGADDELQPGADAVVVASHGRAEEQLLTEALRSGVPYVALVAGRKRGSIVRESLDVPDELRARLHTPAGLDIKAASGAEIAIAILAEMIGERRHAEAAEGEHVRPAASTATASAVRTAIDPICGMEVAIVDSALSLETPDGPVYFCGEHCRTQFAEQLLAAG